MMNAKGIRILMLVAVLLLQSTLGIAEGLTVEIVAEPMEVDLAPVEEIGETDLPVPEDGQQSEEKGVMSTVANEAAADGLAIDREAFPDDAFRAYVAANFDSNGDGVLTDAEAGQVRTIECREMGIASLKGIEHFAKLTNLDCGLNALTSLETDQNLKLESLTCDGNKLTGLDLAKNKKLELLDCSHNRLTGLNLAKNKKLGLLICSHNRLTQLDVSKNKVLYGLSVDHNKIKRLDIRNCPHLIESLEYDTCWIRGSVIKWGFVYTRSSTDYEQMAEDLAIDKSVKLTKGKTVLYRPGKPKSIRLNYTSIEMLPDEQITLIPTLTPSGTVSKIKWSSGNKKIATADNGIVHAHAPGKTKITATTANGLKATCKVTVLGKKVNLDQYWKMDVEEAAKQLGLSYRNGRYRNSKISISEGDYDWITEIEITGATSKYRIAGLRYGMKLGKAKSALKMRGWFLKVVQREPDGSYTVKYSGGGRQILLQADGDGDSNTVGRIRMTYDEDE